MKSKLSKIILFALTLALLFGAIPVSAFESYDTYTYSIDGEPLKSPAAYTPDFVTYDSSKMGLLTGNTWAYGDDGVPGYWSGLSMQPKVDKKDISDWLIFELSADGQSYSIVGIDWSFYDDYLPLLEELYKEVDKVKEEYDAPEKDEDRVSAYYIKISPSDFVGEDIPEMTVDNFIEVLVSVYENVVPKKIASIKETVKKEFETRLATWVAAMAKHEANPEKNKKPSDPVLERLLKDGVDKNGKATKVLDADKLDAYVQNKLRYAPDESELDAIVGILRNLYDPDEKSVVIPANYTSQGYNELPLPVSSIAEGLFDPENSDLAPFGKLINTVFFGTGMENQFSDSKIFTNSGTKIKFYTYSEAIKFGNMALHENCSDMVADNEGNIYIADRLNNRIVVLNKRDFKVIGVMGEYVDEYGRPQSLNNPYGIYVTNPDKMVDSDKREIYVCDTDNKRIVVFDEDFQYNRTIEEPKSALLGENDFKLHAIAVDIYGRIFAISYNCYQGVMVLSDRGEFIGFIGAQKVSVDPIRKLWNKFFTTAEQREDDIKNLPKPYNNITVDYTGFVYVTVDFDKPADLQQQLASVKSKSSNYSPVKKLNSTGVEIMKRNGFFDPGGEVILSSDATKTVNDLSVIKDVAIGKEGSWSLLDQKRSRIFTYDSNGNLLFAFGDKGDQVGNGEGYIALTYQVIDDDYNMVLLDKSATGVKVIVYHPTDYCDKIMSALHNENVHNHSATIDDWQDVLTRNNNFDLAYIGIGKALYNQREYDAAMKMLSSAYETTYYAKAFAEVRKEILSYGMIPLIIGIIAILVLFFKFLGWAKKKNKATSLKVGRKSYGEELLYICHLVFHPFDGFWDLKHEKRGSVRAATTILGVTVLAFFYQAIGQGYMFNPRGDYSTVLLQVIAVLVPVLLWVISNWCLTTLFDGEGSLKDIYIATCYSLAPLPLFVILSTILTNVFTSGEGAMVSLLITIGYVWVGLLLFFGTSVTHDYSMGKNVITILGTIVAMAVIMFIAILFSSLVIKMITFLVAIITEIINLA